MTKYIDKAEVVAEIEKRKQEWQYGSSIEAKYKHEECDDILSFIDTLEVKEFDLDEEIERFVQSDEFQKASGTIKVTNLLAEHFFKLGIQKAKEGDKL